MTKNQELRRAADEAAIAGARLFTVMRFRGRSPTDGAVPRNALWERNELRAEDHGGTPIGALAAARALKARLGTDEYGRRPLIYAVTATGMSVFVE